MIAKIRMNVPESFIEVEIDEYRNGRFKKYTVEEANRLLTRANPMDGSEDLSLGFSLDLPNTIGIFAPGPNIKFEFHGVQQSFMGGKIPYDRIINDAMASVILRDTFLSRIRAVRSWTDQQIEVRCEKVDLDKFGKFDAESRKLFLDGDGKMQVLVQYIMTKGPRPMPNIEIFINGVRCENRRDRPPKDLRWSTEEIVAKGAIGGSPSQSDHCSIFTPHSSVYQYGKWKSPITSIGGEIDYGGNLQAIERALNKRIADFRMNVTNLIKVDVNVARR